MIFEMKNLVEQYWKIPRCNSIHLAHIKFSISEIFEMKLLLGKY